MGKYRKEGVKEEIHRKEGVKGGKTKMGANSSISRLKEQERAQMVTRRKAPQIC